MAGIATGLDFASVMLVAAAQGADLDLIADVLPEFEIALLSGAAGDAGEDE